MNSYPGRVLQQQYRLVELLGEGGMGEVWEALELSTGRCVALKFLKSSPDEPGFAEAKARFEQEARSVWELTPPSLVRISSLEECEGQLFLVMERLFGETLAQHLERTEFLSLLETAEIVLQVVSAVGLVHERGIIHRDLKPSNIFLLRTEPGAAPRVKVLDFGIAKWMPDAEGHRGVKTNTGSTLGTPSYMAPEQATGDRRVDHRVDLWTIGVILYESLSGVRPVEGQNAAQMVVRLLTTGIMPLEHLEPELPRDITSLVGRLLSRDPNRRPRDLCEVRDVLKVHAGISCPTFGPPHGAMRP